jgi:hypothetical protein
VKRPVAVVPSPFPALFGLLWTYHRAYIKSNRLVEATLPLRAAPTTPYPSVTKGCLDTRQAGYLGTLLRFPRLSLVSQLTK